MRQQMHDIISISNKIGHSDIFVTVTGNPNWPEMRRAILGYQAPLDRPMSVAACSHSSFLL